MRSVSGAVAIPTRAATSAGWRRMRACEMPAAETRTSFSKRLGSRTVVSAAMNPPIELPTIVHCSTPSASQKSKMKLP